MNEKRREVFEKFSIRVIGEHNRCNEFERDILNKKIYEFMEDYTNYFDEGEFVLDIKYQKGNHNQGRYRNVTLVNTKIRISTDKGQFIASKENWGVISALNDTLGVLAHVMRDKLKNQNNHVKISAEA